MLLCRILRDAELQTNVAVDRDALEIERRVENEGVSFLTIALPSLSSALDKGLAKGFLTPADFSGFKPTNRGGKLPALLAGFFRKVFNSDGSLREKPDATSICCIRQVANLFKKVELPCSSARVTRAYERYISNDEQCQSEPPEDYLYQMVCRFLWPELEELTLASYCHRGIHGSGATSERLRPNERWSITSWPERGEYLFPLSAFASYKEDDAELFGTIDLVEEDNELPVRVVQVPKTLKTPRTISVEPNYMMLRQQSIAKPLMDYLEGPLFPHSSIRFSDQSFNQELACVGSIDGYLSTIDLSDASDLVSNHLVNKTFGSAPLFLEFIQAARSQKAQDRKSVV